MTETELKRRIQLITIIAIVLVFALIFAIIIQYANFWSLNAKQRKLERELAFLEAQQSELQNDYNYKNSADFIEEYAREVLGWGRDNEVYYRN